MKKDKEITPAQGTLALPYEPITKVASRDTIRDLAKNKETAYGRQSYYIKYAIITWRPGINGGMGFNGRIKPSYMSEEEWEIELDIKTLALDMLANGHHEPLKGDLNENGTIFWLTDGERRYRAIGWLLNNGHTHYDNGVSIDMVEVVLNPRETTEEQRLLIMLSTDSKKNYKPIELGHMFLRLKQHFGYSNDKIAKARGISRQQVDNMVKLAEEPKEIQDAIISGKLLPTAAIELINKEKDPLKRIDIVTGKVAAGDTIKVKDAGMIAKYKDYHDLLAAVLERHKDGLINFDAAQEEINEIGNNALKYLSESESKEIYSTWDNTSEVLAKNQDDIDFSKIDENAGGELKEDDISELGNDVEYFRYEDTVTITDESLTVRFKEALSDFSLGKTDYIAATHAICAIGLEATKLAPEEAEGIDELERNTIKALDQLKALKDKQKVKVVETDEAIDAEEETRKTSSNYKEPSRSETQGDDALAPIDFKKDKEMGEMELSEALGLLDKLVTKMGLFPANLKQYVDDVTGLAIVTQNKIRLGIEIIKRAADKR